MQPSKKAPKGSFEYLVSDLKARLIQKPAEKEQRKVTTHSQTVLKDVRSDVIYRSSQGVHGDELAHTASQTQKTDKVLEEQGAQTELEVKDVDNLELNLSEA